MLHTDGVCVSVLCCAVHSAYARIYCDVRKSSLFYFTSNLERQPNGNILWLVNNNCTLFTYEMTVSGWLAAIAAPPAAQRTVKFVRYPCDIERVIQQF